MHGNIKNSECFLIYFTEKLGNIEIKKKLSAWHFLDKAHLFYLQFTGSLEAVTLCTRIQETFPEIPINVPALLKGACCLNNTHGNHRW